MAVIVDGSEIVLSGMVGGSSAGDSFFAPDGFSSGDVISALAEVGREANIVLRLNSGGGIATEGAAIHSALAQHKGTVQVVVEGIAASAASVIAMAADTLTMTPGSVMMIHDPAGMTFGDAAAHEQTIKALNALGDAYAGIYADRTGKTPDEMRKMMRAETWMTAEEAIALGFADGPAAANDNPPEPTAFAYQIYARAPRQLVAMAEAKGWKPRVSFAASAAPVEKDKPMSEVAAAPVAEAEPMSTSITITLDEFSAENLERALDETTILVEPVVAADPTAPSVEDVIEISAMLADAHFGKAQISAFIRQGGTKEQAIARAAEVAEIVADIETAKRCNPVVTMTVADAVARNLSPAAVRAEMWPQVTKQADIAPQAPLKAAQPVNPMAKAMAKQNARIAG